MNMDAAKTIQERGDPRALSLKRLAHRAWLGVREWCGDSAYERYVQAQRTMPGEASLLTPAEFYVEQLNRRYSRPNRCC
jgi:uncharacterized short protein YbdD (DUF466 family)